MRYIIIIILCALIFASCVGHDTYERRYKRVCSELKSKEIVKESVNGYGDFVNVYYFLYEDGRLRSVTLKDYMSYDIGDKLCVDEEYMVRVVE